MEEVNTKIPGGSKQDFWRQHIDDCSRSPLNQYQYCRAHSLALSTFGYWKRKLRKSPKDNPRFYPLTVQQPLKQHASASNSGLSLHMGKGRFRIELAESFSEVSLRKLITTLEQL